jgi:hypothetical protein
LATTVIIPARNEEVAISNVVRAFRNHPETRNDVYVAIDKATTDSTPFQAREAGATPIHTHVHGKGQNVYQACLAVSVLPGSCSARIILCDGDYEGLTAEHIEKILIKFKRGMVIGVPDWPDIDVPSHVTNAWPRASGFRCLPWLMIPADAHGYLLETQLNNRAITMRMPMPFVSMPGLKSPFQWPLTARRMAALQLDREWGTKNGVL